MSQSVLISGGGIVGSFLGLELAAREIPFKIIEKNLLLLQEMITSGL